MEDRISESGSKKKIIYIAVTLQFPVCGCSAADCLEAACCVCCRS